VGESESRKEIGLTAQDSKSRRNQFNFHNAFGLQ
jgi:hypothetical protein